MKDTIRKLFAYLMVFIMLFNSCPASSLAEVMGSGSTRIELPEGVVDAGEGFTFGDIAPISLGTPDQWDIDTTDLARPQISVGLNGTEYGPGSENIPYTEGDVLEIYFRWKEVSTSWGEIQHGSSIEFDLPTDDLFDFNGLIDGKIVADGCGVIGSYKVENGKLIVTFDGPEANLKAFNDKSDRYIGISLKGQLKFGEDEDETQSRKKVKIGEGEYTFKTTRKPGSASVNNNMTALELGADGKYHSTVTVQMRVSGGLKSATLTDKLLKDSLSINGDIKVTKSPKNFESSNDYKITKNGNRGFDIEFGSLNNGDVITVTYDVVVDADDIGEYLESQEANKVTGKYTDRNGDTGKSEDSGYTATKGGKPSASKSWASVRSNENGTYIDWTLTFNTGF